MKTQLYEPPDGDKKRAKFARLADDAPPNPECQLLLGEALVYNEEADRLEAQAAREQSADAADQLRMEADEMRALAQQAADNAAEASSAAIGELGGPSVRGRGGARVPAVEWPWATVHDGFAGWARPAADVPPEGAECDVELMVVDVHNTVVAGEGEHPRPVVEFYGTTGGGVSVMLRMVDFLPFFYVRVPDGFVDTEALGALLEDHLAASFKNRKGWAFARRVMAVELVRGRGLYGFQPDEATFAKLTLAVPELVTHARALFRGGVELPGFGRQYPSVHEADILFKVRAMVDKGIGGGGWVTARARAIAPAGTQLAFEAAAAAVEGHEAKGERAALAPLRVLSFDIECKAPEKKFPKARRDPVIQISLVLSELGRPGYRKLLLALDTCNAIADTDTRCYSDEYALFVAFEDAVKTIDPDVVTGYNILKFDFPYLETRARAIGVPNFMDFAREPKRGTRIVIGKQSGSKQTGSFVSNEVTILGRVVMDMFSVIRRARPNLKRFTLNAVSKSLLGEQKEDVPPHMIAKLQDGTAATRHRLGVYCVRDSVLPLRLMDKLMLLIQLIEQARLCFVPIEFILTRGQQVKVVTLIYRFAAEEGMFVDWIPHDGADDGGKGFEGAIVIPPVAGFYDVPVVTLDFMSLYPSIMMAHNLCFTTLAKPAKRALIAPEKLATTPAGVTFVRDEYEVVENGETVTKPGHKGLLPSILARLLDARRAAKRDMAAAAAAGDVVRESIYNAKQLALKVVCNSVYGFTGARRGKLPCLEISGSVTAYGRDMINLTRTKIEERYCRKNGFSCDAKVIYGDSVTEDTPILVRRGQAIEIVRIDEMAEGGWSPWHRTKEAADCRLEVWTDQGWTNVKRVIRHTIPAEKHIIEVLTPTGVVKVTDEHSLLRPDGSMVDAKDVEVGTPLLHAICPESPCIETVSTNEAWQMGLFFADETAVEIADFYQPLFYDSSGNKRVPPFILSGPYAVRRAFFEGYYAGDGHKDNSGFVQCVVKGQIGAAGLFQIMSSIGYQVGIDTREDAHDIYCLAAIRAAECPWENPSVIKKIREVKHGVIFVFDLQTDNGHFSAGSGRLVGHNTDSVMIRINDKKMTMAEVMAFGREAAEYVTRFFRRPIKLEFEKVYNPYLLMKKKRYAGLYWTKPDKPDFLDKKGVESKRRGYPLFTEQAVDAVFELIIRQRDPAAAMAHALAQLQVLLDGEVGMDHLKINCGLTRDSKDFKKTVGTQNQLRDRMLERARRGEMALNDVPDIGDRIDYVMVAVGQRKNGKWLGAAAQRAEDPTYAFEHGLPLDYAWYAEKRYVDVMARILSFVDPDALRKLKAVTPRHVRARGVASGALAAFVRAGQTCAGCNARIMGAKRTPALCDRCRPSAGVLLMVRMAEVERLQAEQAALSGTCHRCQGDSFRPVTCSNNTCAIFYKRFETERACTDAERRMRQDFGELF